MGSRFLFSFLAAFMSTALGLSAVGYGVTRMAVSQPREPFRAGSFEFALAPGWWCEREGAETVCNPAGRPPYAATVIIAIKERNDNDNLLVYERHLQMAEKTGVGQASLSEVRYVNRRKLGTIEWVEALHLGSEVKNYYTYYLATSTSALGILVTMSVHRDYLEIYRPQLIEMMATLNTYQR